MGFPLHWAWEYWVTCFADVFYTKYIVYMYSEQEIFDSLYGEYEVMGSLYGVPHSFEWFIYIRWGPTQVWMVYIRFGLVLRGRN